MRWWFVLRKKHRKASVITHPTLTITTIIITPTTTIITIISIFSLNQHQHIPMYRHVIIIASSHFGDKRLWWVQECSSISFSLYNMILEFDKEIKWFGNLVKSKDIIESIKTVCRWLLLWEKSQEGVVSNNVSNLDHHHHHYHPPP